MNESKKTMRLKSAWYPALAALLVGVSTVMPQVSLAETKDGKVNASQDSATVKRDPFWPVGYVSRQMRGQETKEQGKLNGSIDWDEAMKQVVINGVSSRAGNEYVAVINNEVRTLGESVSISYRGVNYTWKVDKITPSGSVKLRRHSVK